MCNEKKTKRNKELNVWRKSWKKRLDLIDTVNENGVTKRSAFGVLLAGAKRAATTAKLNNDTLATNGKEKTKKRRGQWGQRQDYSSRSCPMYKKISGTDFVCDGFQYAKPSLTQNYFLTHFHSDHWGGITKNWDAGTIYCSSVTASLVHQQLGVDKKYLHPLPMLTPTVIGSRGKAVTVTLIDANHCPGAVMFLFEIGNRHVLHVGDFRWNRKVMQSQPPLQPFFGDKRIAELYLDTTYCNPKYDLPSQDAAINDTIRVVQEHVLKARHAKERLLLLFGAYTIGKERIFMAVAESLGMKVYVDKRRYRVLAALEWPASKMSLLTTQPEESRLVGEARCSLCVFAH